MKLPVPREFSRFRVGPAHVVAHESCVAWVREALERGTLYEWAAAHPERRAHTGRVPAYAIPLPGDERSAVVRRSHHGGLLGPVRGDLFLPPTRAPYELLVSQILTASNIRTPPVMAIAVYAAGRFLRRSDVVTLELPGRDLGTALLEPDSRARREAWVPAVVQLLRSLASVGAWHPDLNVRNVLLAPGANGEEAYVLDVDRIRFMPPGDPHVAGANLDRLVHSARKWRDRHGTGFDEAELALLRERAMADRSS